LRQRETQVSIDLQIPEIRPWPARLNKGIVEPGLRIEPEQQFHTFVAGEQILRRTGIPVCSAIFPRIANGIHQPIVRRAAGELVQGTAHSRSDRVNPGFLKTGRRQLALHGFIDIGVRIFSVDNPRSDGIERLEIPAI
jgi:hypothetical protein